MKGKLPKQSTYKKFFSKKIYWKKFFSKTNFEVNFFYKQYITKKFHKNFSKKLKKKDVNRDSHIASSSISQSSFFKGVHCLILSSSQRKLREYIEFL